MLDIQLSRLSAPGPPAILATTLLLSMQPSQAGDRAVMSLLQGQQPAHRSQVITPEQIERVEQGIALARQVLEDSSRVTARPQPIQPASFPRRYSYPWNTPGMSANRPIPDSREPGQSRQNGVASIPAGEFLSGDDKHSVVIAKPYRMEMTEVSNRQYQAFLDALAGSAKPGRYAHSDEPDGHRYQPRYWQEYRPALFIASAAAKLAPFDAQTFTQPDNPVVGVDWWDAYAYCQWAGKRLPTEPEWEKGARGEDGRVWPWGNDWDYANANSGGDKWGEVDGFIYAAPVVSFGGGASVYGLLNMGGNVAEWTAGANVMGGSSNSRPSGVRTSAKQKRNRDYRSFNIGFRCASDA